MLTKNQIKVFVIGVLVLLPYGGQAQVQRMGIPRGTYNLSPRSSKQINAYCMDYGRKAPTQNVRFNHILTNSENARVTIGGRTMRLQYAIENGYISVEGTSLSWERLFEMLDDPLIGNRLSTLEKAQLREIKKLWDRLSLHERQQAEEALNQMLYQMGERNLSEAGDYTRLIFINKTNEQVTINFVETTVLGEQKETVSGLFIENITPARDREHQDKIQKKIWFEANKLNQIMLKRLGCYAGDIDGLIGPKTEQAVKSFQQAFGLSQDGVLNGETEAMLKAAFSSDKRIQELNEGNKNTYLLTIEENPRHGETSEYVVYAGVGMPIYRGNNIPQLVNKINSEFQQKELATIYLDMKGFAQNKIEGFATSCRIQQRRIDPTISLKTFGRRDNSLEVQDIFFTKGIEFRNLHTSEISMIQEGKYKGFMHTKLKIISKAKQFALHIYSKIRSTISDFIDMFQKPSLSTYFRNESLQTRIHEIRQALKIKYDLSDDDLIIEFEDQFGEIHVVVLKLEIGNS